MLAVNGHAKHGQSLCRVGYGKTALSMDLFFITTAKILSNHTFLLLSRFVPMEQCESKQQKACIGMQAFCCFDAQYIQSLSLKPEACAIILASSRATSLKNSMFSIIPKSGKSIGRSTSSSAPLRSIREYISNTI